MGQCWIMTDYRNQTFVTIPWFFLGQNGFLIFRSIDDIAILITLFLSSSSPRHFYIPFCCIAISFIQSELVEWEPNLSIDNINDMLICILSMDHCGLWSTEVWGEEEEKVGRRKKKNVRKRSRWGRGGGGG